MSRRSISASFASKLCRHIEGTAAVEFAIVAPAFLLMMIGMICFGLYFFFNHEIQELASSATRASVAGLNPAERDSIARQYIATALQGATFLNAADLTIATNAVGTPATYYQVTLNYNLQDTPIPLVAGLLSLNLQTITGTSTIQFGNY